MVFKINWKAVGQRLAIAAVTANEDVFMATLRGWLNKRLSLYTDDDLLYAIDHNVDLLAGMADSEIAFVHNLARDPKIRPVIQKYEKRISADTVIKWWLKEDRRKEGRTTGPDKSWADIILYFPNGKGRNWLEIQLGKAKQQLLGVQPS